VPTGLALRANVSAANRVASGVGAAAEFTSIYYPGITTPTAGDIATISVSGITSVAAALRSGSQFYVRTDTSAQIQHISTTNIDRVVIRTVGWIDDRGKG